MTQPNGVHHLALMTADVKSQIAFFSDVLGMKLKALYWHAQRRRLLPRVYGIKR